MWNNGRYIYINNQGTCFADSNTNTNANINDNTNTNTNTNTSTNTNTNQGTCFADTNDKVINRNKNNIKYYYCDRCTYWFNSQTKYDKHECSTSFKPEIVCPKKKHITFVNEYKRQNIKNTITADIECCIVDPRSGFTDVSTIDLKYVIAEHIPIAVGYT